MLPIPDTTVWSSSARLTPVRRRRIPAITASRSKSGSIGSRAICATGAGRPSTRSSTDRPPNVRWSMKRSSGPPSAKASRTRRCVSSTAPGGWMRICPLIPRWASNASSPPRSSQRYLPRRRAACTWRPASRAAKSSSPAIWRRTERGWCTSTAATVRPATCSARPSRTTSTSASSGMALSRRRGAPAGQLGQRAPGHLGGPLLGFFLGSALPRSLLHAGYRGGCGELLEVVWPFLDHSVLGHTHLVTGCELLEAGLPIQARTQQRSHHQQRVEQPVHHLAGCVHTVLQVHRADQCLDGVGEDAGLVPAPGELLPPAQQDVLAQAIRTQPAGYASQRVHVHHAGAQLGELTLG